MESHGGKGWVLNPTVTEVTDADQDLVFRGFQLNSNLNFKNLNFFIKKSEKISTGKPRLPTGKPTLTFKVELKFVAKVSTNSEEALRVLDIILRQQGAKQGCLLVGQSFFRNIRSNFFDLGCGVQACRGFHSSFRPTQNGLSLNVDVSTTMIVKPGPVIDFLKINQNVSELRRIDWPKAKRVLKNLRIKTIHTNSEFRIIGLSENTCYEKRYTKSLTTLQRSSLVDKSRQKPHDRMSVLSDAVRDSNYDSEPMLKECSISIARVFTQVDGRVLEAPKLKAGDGEYLRAYNGRWNFTKNRLFQGSKVKSWGAVNFSADCNVQQMDQEDAVIQERPRMIREPPVRRVADMFDQIMSNFSKGLPSFILCVLLEKNNDIYGPWKHKCLKEHGIITQYLAPSKNINDQYITNLLLKMNAKLGGLNSLLDIERTRAIPLVSRTPTIIFGMDVSHGSPGRSDVPSVAAVVSSLEWPLVSKYKASVCTQSPRLEMIDSLFKPVGKEDLGLFKELLVDFYRSTEKRKPEQINIFRDGVSESQFTQVLNIELAQMIEACKFLDDNCFPKFRMIVAQKNHHTRFFLPNGPNPVTNVSPGTVVVWGICHPKNYDFYMCAHAGIMGTTRPTHYHVLHDDIRYTPDELQELVHSLSFVYQRSTTAISVVAPIYYAHLAAAQVRQFVKIDDMSEASSSHEAASAPIPKLPKLHKKVKSSMFFC